MARALRTAALVVGAVALGMATMGVANALSAGMGLAGALSAGAGSLTVLGLGAGSLGAIAAGLGIAGTMLGKQPAPSSGGSQTEFLADPRSGVPCAIGDTGTAGRIVFRRAADGWSANTPNDLNDLIVVLSGAGPIDAITGFTSDKKPVGFDGAGNAIGEFKDKMFQRTQLGAASASIPALTVQAGASAAPTGWTSAHRLPGMAAAIWRLRYDSKQRFFQNGVPQPMWQLRGVKAYDPRLDSSHPGGSGPQRWNDSSTWAWSNNPYIVGLTWCIGWHHNGRRVMGLGATVDQIVVSDFVEGANIADANGWTVGGVIYSRPDTKWNNLKKILQAGAGRPTKVGARIGCMINTPRVSLATITRADIVGEAELPAMQPKRARINTVIPRYRSPDHGWEIVPAAEVRVAGHVAADDGEQTREIEYELVQSATQAAQLARYDIEDSREAGPGSFPLKPVWMGYRAGDCVTLDVPNKAPVKLLLLDRGIDPATTVVTFSVRSETDAKHAAALVQTGSAAPEQPAASEPDFPTPTADEWTLAGGELAAGDGAESVVPVLTFSGAVAASAATDIVFEYRLDEVGSPWRAAGIEPTSATSKSVTSLAANTAYRGSVQYRVGGALSDRLELGPVTVGDFLIGTSASVGDISAAAVQAAIDAVGSAAATISAQQATIDAQQGVIETFGLRLDALEA